MFGASEPRPSTLSSAEADRAATLRAAIDPLQLREALAALPAPRNRLHAPEAMAATDDLLVSWFAGLGWEAHRNPFEYRNASAFIDYEDFTRLVTHESLRGMNILAVKEGTLSRETVMVAAHHDTIRDSPGADDNGAGVIALMTLARILSEERYARTVMLAAVDMEELGLFGSRALVRSLVSERTLVGAFVYETMAYSSSAQGSQFLPPGLGAVYRSQVGRIKRRGMVGDWTAVVYQGASASLAASFGDALAHLAGRDATVLLREPTDLPIIGRLLKRTVPFVRDFSRSDHVAFWEAGVPWVWITDTANFRNPNYHRPTDTPDTIDCVRLADIVVATAVAVERLARQPAPAQGS